MSMCKFSYPSTKTLEAIKMRTWYLTGFTYKLQDKKPDCATPKMKGEADWNSARCKIDNEFYVKYDKIFSITLCCTINHRLRSFWISACTEGINRNSLKIYRGLWWSCATWQLDILLHLDQIAGEVPVKGWGTHGWNSHCFKISSHISGNLINRLRIGSLWGHLRSQCIHLSELRVTASQVFDTIHAIHTRTTSHSNYEILGFYAH